MRGPRNNKKSTNKLEITYILLIVNTIRSTTISSKKIKIKFSLPDGILSSLIKKVRRSMNTRKSLISSRIAMINCNIIIKHQTSLIQISLLLSCSQIVRKTLYRRTRFKWLSKGLSKWLSKGFSNGCSNDFQKYVKNH